MILKINSGNDNYLAVIEEATDPAALAKVHILCFPDFYTTRMGLAFLKEYYSLVLSYQQRVAIVVKVKGKIVGFAVGFYNPSEFYKTLKERRYRLLFHSLGSLIKDPTLILRTLTNSRRVDFEKHITDSVELSSIAVLPSFKGLGSQLIKSFLEKAFQKSPSAVLLTTDAVDNESTNRFYIKNGFKLTKTYDDNGRLMNQYSIEPGSQL